MIKANLFEMGIVLLMVGCLEASALFEPADSNDPITLEKIIAEATDVRSLQKRREKGKELYYSPDEQTLYTGWGKEMHDNGRIKSLIQVKEGKMSGLINAWYENGQKKAEGTFKDGKLDGLILGWYENGRKKGEGNSKEGKVMSATTWKPNGEKCPLTNLKEGNGVSVAYYESGQMMMKENYKDGNRNGSYVRWNENGRKSIEGNYKNGKMHGFVTKWYENGHKKEEGNYKDGKPDGLWTKWFANGLKEWVQTWKNDKKDGLSTDWYENGRKRSEANFRKGKLRSAVVRKPNGEKCPVTNVKEGSGVVVEYNEDGTERFRLIFKDGERVEEELEDLLKNPFPVASPI